MQLDGMVYQGIEGIPMGTNCAPLIADLSLYYNKRDFMSNLQKSKRFDLIDTFNDTSRYLKAILQVLIYKALYDKSYLGSKTTMTSCEWTCLISFATAPLTCSERGGSKKFKMKINVSSGIRTHTPPVHDRKVAAP